MGQSYAVGGRPGISPGSETKKTESRASGLLARIYRDIGLAAVAGALEIPAGELTQELADAIKRGARYVFLMPGSCAPAEQADIFAHGHRVGSALLALADARSCEDRVRDGRLSGTVAEKPPIGSLVCRIVGLAA